MAAKNCFEMNSYKGFNSVKINWEMFFKSEVNDVE